MQTLENMMDESSVCHTKLLHHISSKQKLGFDAMVRGENTAAVVNVLTSDKLKALIQSLKESSFQNN
jgi:hypothetical protein